MIVKIKKAKKHKQMIISAVNVNKNKVMNYILL